MNLSAYDIVERNTNYGTWILPQYKRLYSRSIEYHSYYCFLKRYNDKTKCNDWYIALFDEIHPEAECHSTVRDNKNIIKINLAPIWNELYVKYSTDRTFIYIDEVEKTEDGVIYLLGV